MPRPRVVVYNETSVDGRITGFAAEPERYYRLGFRWRADAILMGSVTAQSFGPAETVERQASVLPPPVTLPVVPGFEHLVHEPRPLLVVPDSRGEVRCWIDALAQPWYRGVLVLASQRTPAEYLAYLDRRGIDHLVVGEARVDLGAALETLHADYGIRLVRTDCGGALTGALLVAGVVDEVAILVNPKVSGRPDGRSVVQLPKAMSDHGIPLRLVEVERLDDGSVWLRYDVS